MSEYENIIRKVFCADNIDLCMCGLAMGAIKGNKLCHTYFFQLPNHNPEPFNELHKGMTETGFSLDKSVMDSEYQKGKRILAAHELNPDTFTDEDWGIVGECSNNGIIENRKQVTWKQTVEKLSDPNLTDLQKRKLLQELNNVIEGNTQKENHYKRVSITDKFPHANYVFEFNGIPLIKVGQLSIITGQEGIGKTTLTNMIITAYLTGTWKHAITRITDVGKVLSIDTELPDDDLQSRIEKIHTMSGLSKLEDDPRVDFYTGIELSSKERQSDLETLLDSNQYGLLIVDNYNDYFEDPNNSEEAGNVKDFFAKLINRYKFALILVTHDNPTFDINSSKCSYASGTRVARFSRAIIRMSFDLNSNIHTCTLAKNSYGRDKIPILKFSYDNQGYLQNVPLEVPSFPENSNIEDKTQKEFEIRDFWLKIFRGEKLLIISVKGYHL